MPCDSRGDALHGSVMYRTALHHSAETSTPTTARPATSAPSQRPRNTQLPPPNPVPELKTHSQASQQMILIPINYIRLLGNPPENKFGHGHKAIVLQTIFSASSKSVLPKFRRSLTIYKPRQNLQVRCNTYTTRNIANEIIVLTKQHKNLEAPSKWTIRVISSFSRLKQVEFTAQVSRGSIS